MFRALCMVTVAAGLLAPALAGPDEKKHDTRRMESKRTYSDMDGARARTKGSRETLGMVNVYPIYERRIPDEFYRDAYRLTPREYRRLRAMGFRPHEVYMIANASARTGLEPRVFADALYRGMLARDISLEFGIPRNDLRRVLPEWRTPEWSAAAGDPAVTGEWLNVWW